MISFFKIFVIFLLLLDISKTHASTANKTTTFSLCSRSDQVENTNRKLTIIVAMETLSEKSCKKLCQKKAEQYASVGWTCVGKKNEMLFSCESERASTFAFFNGTKLDNLTFTNLQKHRSLVAYLNPNSNKLCHEDRDELRSAGVKDAVCHLKAP